MTRRPATAAALLLALGLLLTSALAACGSSSSDGGSSEPAANSEGNDDAGSAGGTVTIEHRYGSTEAPVAPERIVSLDTQWTDVLAALDAPPAGYIADPSSPDGYPWREDLLDDSAAIEAVDQLPYEKIAALKPDLIVVSYLAQDEGDYEKLSAIAPTIATLSDAEVDTWQDITAAAGQVLGQEDEAAALVEQVDGGVAKVAEELPGLDGKTYSLVNYVAGDRFYVVADPDDGAAVLFDQLGLAITPDILDAAKGASGRVELSLENAELFDADLILLLANGSDPEDISGWNELQAVQDGAEVVLDYDLAVGLNTPTPLSIPYALEEIRPALEAAAAA
ncbi:MAG TPA: ABC transporter substrate-binding protein [Acidimicrobiales bacterium]|nr:ABC transporter substrate-binding protein [Acidimicrobiales bacterium]